MTRYRRVALVLTGVALLAVAAIGTVAFLAARSGRLHAALGKALGRDVRVQHVGFTLRGGIGVALSGVEIADDPASAATEPFLRADVLAMRLRLLPLLRRRLVVDGILIEQPVVNLVRERSGRLNVESFRKRPAQSGAEQPSPAHRRPAFQLISLRLRHGTIRYRDAGSGRTVELTDVAVDVRQPQFDSPVPVSVRARLATEGVRLDDIVSEGIVELARDPPAYHGSVRAGSGAFGSVLIDGLKGEVRASPPTVDLESGELEVFGGRLTGSAHLGDGALTARLDARDLDLAKLPAPPDRPRPAGTLALRGTVAAPPPDDPRFKVAATGQGEFSVADGRIDGAGFGRPILDVLQPFLRSGLADRLRQRYPDLFASDDLRFTRLSGSARLAGGRIRSDDLVLAATSYEARGEGSLGVDGDVEATVRVAASPALTDDVLAQSRARPMLVDTSGRLVVPLRVRGPVRRPRVTPDPAFAATAARALVGGGLGEVAGDVLERLLGGRHRRDR